MANPEHVEIVKQGADAIRDWRAKNDSIRLDLFEADLTEANLELANLVNANLSEAVLSRANLHKAVLDSSDLMQADLFGADLSMAQLNSANMRGAKLRYCDLSHAELRAALLAGGDLMYANLNGADLRDADLTRADLSHVSLIQTWLGGASLEQAFVGLTTFADVDLSKVKALASVHHDQPSSIGVDTLYRSQGKIPEEFLRGCGVPEDFITYLPLLIGTMQPIQYQSCFISDSSRDEEFARRLHEKMRGEKLRVWFAPEDMQGGQKLIEQIDRAIQVNDRLLLVLSEQSMNSEWVKTEIRKARQAELREQRQKLFSIRLVSIDRIRDWSCFDADTGKDLAVELREYHIPDFSNWKNHDPFESAFADLLRDLRAQA